MFLFLILSINSSFGESMPRGSSVSRRDWSEQPEINAFQAPSNRPPSQNGEQVQITRSSPEVPVPGPRGNLPGYLQGPRPAFQANETSVLTTKNKVAFLGAKVGDMLSSVINQEIKASPTVPTPIRAYILSGPVKGGYFVGEATLDKELKRVLLDFNYLRAPGGRIYAVKAKGLAPNGSIGIEGSYHSQAGLFFLGELGAATAAGVLDSTVNRNQTSFGTYVQEPSLGNSSKTGAVTALSKTADKLAETTRNAPEYTATAPNFEIKVFIQEDPVETGFTP